MDWQQISTAPKDGTRLLGLRPYRDGSVSVWACYWQTAEQVAEKEGGEPDEYEDGWVDDDATDFVCPTHWMPLPEPPVSP